MIWRGGSSAAGAAGADTSNGMAVREMMTITATTKDHEALALVLEMGTETVALTVALTVTVIAITTEDLGTLALVPLAEGGGNESGAENLPAKPGIATHARRLLPRGWRSDIFLDLQGAQGKDCGPWGGRFVTKRRDIA